ncbi:YebC/PmpR family DNA-binding transcriptional regulator [Candidatus Uhrbacteria bacterium]|nr:YebC/PmpR family DNA-binding transcriptional regulator [Candidatus Uhrbacteria bacterium]
MARHSHWHNIQLTKGKADAKRAQSFAKLAKSLTAAAKEGGSDPAFNVSLRMAMDAARAANMPKDNIDRAIACATGEGAEGVSIEEILYEGFGPGGSALLIQCLTDNRNRSVTEVRTIMNKNGGTMASPGSVKWLFEKKGVVIIQDIFLIPDREAFELALIEAGAEDFIQVNFGLEIRTPLTDFKSVLDTLETFGIYPGVAAIEHLAKDPVELAKGDRELLHRLVDKLEELDDVETVFTNEE